jgi:hypothetical protein
MVLCVMDRGPTFGRIFLLVLLQCCERVRLDSLRSSEGPLCTHQLSAALDAFPRVGAVMRFQLEKFRGWPV